MWTPLDCWLGVSDAKSKLQKASPSQSTPLGFEQGFPPGGYGGSVGGIGGRAGTSFLPSVTVVRTVAWIVDGFFHALESGLDHRQSSKELSAILWSVRKPRKMG